MTRRHTKDFISGVKMQKEILEKHHYHDDGVLSYIEEFKFLFFEWVLSKMKTSDIPYLFHHVPGMFRLSDRRYLKRLFDAYPRRKIEYYLLMTRSSLAYFAAKGALHLGRKIKRGLKSAFKIEREGCYTVFKLFGRKHRIFRKKVALDSMAWYEQKARQDERLVWQANSERDARVQEAEARYAALTAEKDELAVRLGEMQERLESVTEAEPINKEAFDAYVKALRDHIEFIEGEKTELAVSLKETRQKASEAESQMLHYSEKLADAAQSIVELNDRCLAYQKANEDANAQMAQLNKENYGFYRSVWTTGWMKRWKDFYHRNYLRIEELKDRLKAGLDEESTQIVDRQCFRTFELLPVQEYDELFKYDHLKIYTQAEREGAAQKLDEEEIRSRFVIAPEDYLEVPVFRFHCGLKFLPEKVLETIRGRDVIDGGAYWGDSALIFSTYAPRSITAFEPQPETFGKLETTIRNNGLQEMITPVQMGLGDTDTDAVLYSNDMLSASNISNINAVKTSSEIVENPIRVTSIDSYTAAHDLNVGLIKLDVEGNESATIKGAMETIRRDKPVLLISIYHTPEDFFDIKPLLEAEDLGYHFMVRKLVFADLVTEIMLIGHID